MQNFINTMLDVGLNPPPHIEPGTWPRFPGIDKSNGNKAGYAHLFPDGLGGIYGDFASDIKGYWQHDQVERFTPEERINFNALIKAAEEKIRLEKEVLQAEAALQAQAEWDSAKPADPNHPYLKRKQVKPHGLRQIGANLVMALSNSDDVITTHQIIRPDGSKKFMYGGKKQGSSFIIHGTTDRTFVCEGYATGASAHEATGRTVFVAVDAGNLLPVVEGMLQKGIKRIVIAADNDNG